MARLRKSLKRAGLLPVGDSAPAAASASVNFQYGRDWGDTSQLSVELMCFRDDVKPGQGGLGKAEHAWNVIGMLWPATSRKPFLRNPWSERMIAEASRHNFLSVSGCASSSKSDTSAVWAIVNWLADPLGTKVLCTSTTLRESRKRIWDSIEDYWNALPYDVRAIGKLVTSFGLIRLPGS